MLPRAALRSTSAACIGRIDGFQGGTMLTRMSLLFALSAVAPVLPAAEVTQIVTDLAYKADEYPGSEYRRGVDQASAYVREGRPSAAWNVLQPGMLYCDGKRNTETEIFYSVADKAEERELRDRAPPGTTVTFVDWACPLTYKQAAFLAIDTNEPERARALLDRAEAIAPHWADVLAERAYLTGHQGDWPGALALYRKAQALAQRYSASAQTRALILRGIGYALVEAGDLDGAAQAYRDSLKLDPDSEVGKKELQYIQERKAAADRSD
ncbi:TPR repeat family protein [Lysobacter gummosus]|nr:TPR repeat family protein [Lysobacter gummosus]